jgi:hypothetical protein
MSEKNKIAAEVDKTLALLDKARSVKSNPFLFKKIEARLRSSERAEVGLPVWQKAIIAPAVMIGAILIGVAIGLNIDKVEATPQSNAFAVYYGLQPSANTQYLLSNAVQ